MIRCFWVLMLFALTASAETPSIFGKWQSNCFALPVRHSFIADLSAGSKDLALDVNLYSDSSCANPSLIINIEGGYNTGQAMG
ncbi:MAG: hypothetical protein ACJ763_05630, partial [Bdellovibrionia bacterium]